jgi:hypothetical protein
VALGSFPAAVTNAIVVERKRPASNQLAVFGLLSGLAVSFIVYVTIQVPVRHLALAPVFTGGQVTRHWPIGVMAVLCVLAGDAIAIEAWIRYRSRTQRDRVAVEPGAPKARVELLRFQRVPAWAVLTTALVSTAVVIGATYLRQPLWERTLWALIPWAPLMVFEEIWKYKHYGFYAIFLGLAAIQVGHLGEHTVQVTQLLIYHGDLTRSHGVFGQLDFETVHFVWDTVIWVSGAVLVWRFSDNWWVWVSWAVASVHQVEHVYLFWMYRVQNEFWAHGGIAGIFGKGGLVGSPFPRPYLHFLYNFFVIVPMLFGLWNETKRVQARRSDP